jgi:hypothetical protein
LLEQLLGRFEAAHDVALMTNPLGEVGAELLDDVGADGAEQRHRSRDLLDLVLMHHREQAGAVFLAQGEHQDRRLLRALEAAVILGLDELSHCPEPSSRA